MISSPTSYLQIYYNTEQICHILGQENLLSDKLWYIPIFPLISRKKEKKCRCPSVCRASADVRASDLHLPNDWNSTARRTCSSPNSILIYIYTLYIATPLSLSIPISLSFSLSILLCVFKFNWPIIQQVAINSY